MATIRERVENVLNEAAESIPGARVRVVTNSDGSVDGELLAPIERGQDTTEILQTAEAAIISHRIPNAFVSEGFRWEPRPIDDPKLYDRYRGLFQVTSAYYPYQRAPEATAVMEAILEGTPRKPGMRAKRFRKPIQAIVRIHWNRQGSKPGRDSR